MFRARLINPFEGSRWRLRRMRTSGCTDLTAMGIESFFVCSLLILLGLGKSEKSEDRGQKLYFAALVSLNQRGR
jgi:hypothetical protein